MVDWLSQGDDSVNVLTTIAFLWWVWSVGIAWLSHSFREWSGGTSLLRRGIAVAAVARPSTTTTIECLYMPSQCGVS
jgi:hypothetical protein